MWRWVAAIAVAVTARGPDALGGATDLAAERCHGVVVLDRGGPAG